MAFHWQSIPEALVGVIEIPLAILLVALNPRSRPNRILALVLFWRSFLFVFPALVDLGVMDSRFGSSVGTYGVLAYRLTLVYFLLIYPLPRATWLRSPKADLLLVAATVLVFLANAANPQAQFGGVDVWVVFNHVGVMMLPVGALILAIHYARRPDASRRGSLLLVSLGFALVQFHDDMVRALGVAAARITPPSDSIGLAVDVISPVLWILLIGYLAVTAVRSKERDVRIAFRTYLLVLAGALLTASIVVAVYDPAASYNGAFAFFMGFWDLALPGLVAYALVRYALFDIDLKVKWTLRRGSVAGAFLAAFLVGTQVAQNYLSSRYSWAFGGVAAGLLLFAVHPLQRAADRLSNAALPNVQNTEEWKQRQKMDAYKSAVELAISDGDVTPDEEVKLANLADALGLSASQMLGLRRDVETAAKRPRPGTV